jgi:NAD(P)H-dependent FMN reductase
VKVIAAPTHHHGYDFVVLLVKDHVLHEPTTRSDMLDFAQREFGVDPVLLGERQGETYGAQRAVNMLRRISPDQLPWREYEYARPAA